MTKAKDPNDLGDFEGRKITKTTIAVTNAGDGLSQALKIDPILLHQGDKVYVVLEAVVGKVTFDPYDDGVAARVQTLKAGVATIMDSDVVKRAIDEQRVKNERAAEKEDGVRRLPVDLHDDHIAGEHESGPADGCPDCALLDEEAAAIAAEARAEEAGKKPAAVKTTKTTAPDNVKPIGSRADAKK